MIRDVTESPSTTDVMDSSGCLGVAASSRTAGPNRLS